MFGKKKPAPSPITDEHRQMIAQLQEQLAQASQNPNHVEKLAAISNLTKEIAQARGKISSDVSALFSKLGDRAAVKTGWGLAGGTVGGITLIALLSAPAAALIGFFIVLPSTPVLLDMPNEARKKYTIGREADFKATCPELLSLNQMSADLVTMRKDFFESPSCVETLVRSPDFPAIFAGVSSDEQKILSYAFRQAAEKKATAAAPVPPQDKSKPGLDL